MGQTEQIVTDEWGHEMGHCNSCGEEVGLGSECCEDGEVEPMYVEQDRPTN